MLRPIKAVKGRSLKLIFQSLFGVNLILAYYPPSLSQTNFFPSKPVELRCRLPELPRPLLLMLQPSVIGPENGKVVNMRDGEIVYDFLIVNDRRYAGMFARRGTKDIEKVENLLGVKVKGSFNFFLLDRQSGIIEISYVPYQSTKTKRISGKCEQYRTKRQF